MKILIVDDEPIVRRALRRFFESKGHEVSEAEDGEEGLSSWKKVKPDLVILDVLMPKMSGPDVLRLRPKDSTKVILISAYSGEYDVKKAKSLGADYYLPKPFQDIREIETLVHTIVGNSETNL